MDSMASPPVYPDEFLDELARVFARAAVTALFDSQGETQRGIAAVFGVGETTVRRDIGAPNGAPPDPLSEKRRAANQEHRS